VRFSFCLLALLLVTNSRAQNLFSTSDSDALFPAPDDLVQHHPDLSCHLRKVEDVRVDSVIHRCWFTDTNKGMIKDVFAVIHDRQLYVQDQFVRQNLPYTFHPHARKESNCYYPVLEQGRYLYFEILSEDKDPDLAIAMGLMGGVVGSAFGTTLTPPDMIRSSVVFDTHTRQFFGIDTWKDFQFFMNSAFPDHNYTTTSGQPKPEEVRHMIENLNKL